MARFEEYEPGQFSWAGLLTPDPAKAGAFYGSLVGWTREDTQDDQGGQYAMLKLGGLDVAGVGRMSPEMMASGMPLNSPDD